VLAKLRADLKGLDATASGRRLTYRHGSDILTTSVELGDVVRYDGGPCRRIEVSEPSQTYTPELTFDEVLRKIRDKGERRQVGGGAGALRGLAVDVARTGIDHDLKTGRITLCPAAAAQANIDPGALGVDFIALTVPHGGEHGVRGGIRADVLFDSARVAEAQLRRLFDFPQPPARCSDQ
jgi:hypothetical protein